MTRLPPTLFSLPLASLLSCAPVETHVSLTVLLPTDQTNLSRADNLSVTLSPSGASVTEPINGLDFSLDIELDPDLGPQSVSVFLAEGSDLLGYGASVPADLAQVGSGALTVFIGEPGALVTFPQVDIPVLAASTARGRGLVTLEPDGKAWFTSHASLVTEPAAALPDPLATELAAGTATLFSDAFGGIVAVAHGNNPAAARFDPGENAWRDLEVSSPELLATRPGASSVTDATGEQGFLFGGGVHLDAVAVSLTEPAGPLSVDLVSALTLDHPRVSAHASWVLRTDTDEGEGVLLFGGDDPAGKAAFFTGGGGVSLGPAGAWTRGACTTLTHEPTADAPMTVLCAGGERFGLPTADAVSVTFPPVSNPEAPGSALTVDFLPVPMAGPLWLEDDGAVYAYASGALVSVDRADLAVETVQSGLSRDGGALSVTLPTGATFVLGGQDDAGTPVSTWQVFTKTLSP